MKKIPSELNVNGLSSERIRRVWILAGIDAIIVGVYVIAAVVICVVGVSLFGTVRTD